MVNDNWAAHAWFFSTIQVVFHTHFAKREIQNACDFVKIAGSQIDEAKHSYLFT